MAQKICITGATGLIGRAISDLWQSKGFEISWLVRSTPKEIPEGVIISQGDILDVQLLKREFEGIDIVIHAAAEVSFGTSSAEKMRKTNVEGTTNVVNACLQQSKLPTLIYLSSVAAIGRSDHELPINERSPWVENKWTSEYALTKYAAELEVWRGQAEGLSVIVLNPSVVCGVSDWNRSSTVLFKNVYEGLLFYPKGSINLVDVRDVAIASYLLYENQIFNRRFILSGHKIFYKTFFDAIADALNVSRPTFPASVKWLLPIYYMTYPFLFWYFRRKMLNAETIRISSTHGTFDGSAITKVINFNYTPWKQTIQYVCEGLMKKYGC